MNAPPSESCDVVALVAFAYADNPAAETIAKVHIDLDECSSNPCQNNATCVNSYCNYTCECLPLYKGRHCEIAHDSCIDNACVNGATCVALNAYSYSCICPSGLHGAYCQTDIDECAQQVCANEANVCVNLFRSYRCECPQGHYGEGCDTACSPTSCPFNSQCYTDATSFYCQHSFDKVNFVSQRDPDMKIAASYVANYPNIRVSVS
jgi:hypothetical protein